MDSRRSEGAYSKRESYCGLADLDQGSHPHPCDHERGLSEEDGVQIEEGPDER